MKSSKETTNDYKTLSGSLVVAALIISIGFNISSLLGGDENKTENKANKMADLTLRSSANESPHLGIFQLGEQVTSDYVEYFASNYEDLNGDELDVEFEVVNGADYEIDTKYFSTERFPVSETETMSFGVVTASDGRILRIGNAFAYPNRVSCEASYEHIKNEVQEFYNVADKSISEDVETNYFTQYDVHIAYPIGEKFYVSVSNDCSHKDVKDVIVRVGLLKEFYLESFSTVDVSLYAKTLFIP